MKPSKTYGAMCMGVPFLLILTILAEAPILITMLLCGLYGFGCALFFAIEDIRNER